MHPFGKADILLPRTNDWEKWAVIACDQFVSQPEYWSECVDIVSDAPSTLGLILPEMELEHDCTAAIQTINQNMQRYLQQNILQQFPDCFIYVERTLLNGTVRTGVVGALDLEAYDFSPASRSRIRATEQTVTERIPPRVQIRENAALELPHILLLCDDMQQLLIESLTAKRELLPLLYDFNLMLGGGRIRGWLVSGAHQQDFSRQLLAYQQRMEEKYGEDAVLYAVGDGNHSLAAAKQCYEAQKAAGQDTSLSRYALAELENIHHSAQVFEPIHRIVKQTDAHALLRDITDAIGCDDGAPVKWHIENQQGVFFVRSDTGLLPVGIIQDFLDDWLQSHPGTVDYIHGEDAVQALSQTPGTLGLILPDVAKDAFFPGIIAGGTLPRKTFSMGHAQEKRYYLEARRIR